MEVTKSLICLALIFSISACSNTPELETGEIKTLQLLKEALFEQNNEKTFVDARMLLSRQQIDAANIPVLFVELESGQNGTLTPYPGQGIGQTWIGADGATLTVNSSAITTATNTFTLDASAETDGILVVTGSAGIDTITMTQSDQADNISLAGAADIIYVSGTQLTSADTINGGNGDDTLSYTSDEVITDTDFTLVTNLEKLTAVNGIQITGTLAVKAKDAGVTTVTFNDDGDGDNLVINSAFNQSTLRLNLDDGDNTFDASAFTGVLTVAVTEAVADAAADTHTVTGGTGTTDELLITADGTGIDTTDMANFTAFEKLTIANDSSTGTIVINTATVADNATLTVNATAITTASNTFTLNASAETNGIIVVQGSAGIDTIRTQEKNIRGMVKITHG